MNDEDKQMMKTFLERTGPCCAAWRRAARFKAQIKGLQILIGNENSPRIWVSIYQNWIRDGYTPGQISSMIELARHDHCPCRDVPYPVQFRKLIAAINSSRTKDGLDWDRLEEKARELLAEEGIDIDDDDGEVVNE